MKVVRLQGSYWKWSQLCSSCATCSAAALNPGHMLHLRICWQESFTSFLDGTGLSFPSAGQMMWPRYHVLRISLVGAVLDSSSHESWRLDPGFGPSSFLHPDAEFCLFGRGRSQIPTFHPVWGFASLQQHSHHLWNTVLWPEGEFKLLLLRNINYRQCFLFHFTFYLCRERGSAWIKGIKKQ